MRDIFSRVRGAAASVGWIVFGAIIGGVIAVWISPIVVEEFVVPQDWPEFRSEALKEAGFSNRETAILITKIDAVDASSTDPELLAISRELIAVDARTRQILWSTMGEEAKSDRVVEATLAGWRVDTVLAVLTAGFAIALALLGRGANTSNSVQRLGDALAGVAFALATASSITLFGNVITLVMIASLGVFYIWSHLIVKGAAGRTRVRSLFSVGVLLFALACVATGVAVHVELGLLVVVAIWSAGVSLVATWVLR